MPKYIENSKEKGIPHQHCWFKSLYNAVWLQIHVYNTNNDDYDVTIDVAQ